MPILNPHYPILFNNLTFHAVALFSDLVPGITFNGVHGIAGALFNDSNVIDGSVIPPVKEYDPAGLGTCTSWCLLCRRMR